MSLLFLEHQWFHITLFEKKYNKVQWEGVFIKFYILFSSGHAPSIHVAVPAWLWKFINPHEIIILMKKL